MNIKNIKLLRKTFPVREGGVNEIGTIRYNIRISAKQTKFMHITDLKFFCLI